MRRVTIAVAVATAAALGLAGCGSESDSGDSGENTSLDLLVPLYGDKTKPYWEQLVKDFEAKNSNIDVKLETQSWDDIYTVLDTKIQNNKAPDILELDAAGPAYGSEDLLYKAEEIVSPETLKDIEPAFIDSAKIDGVGLRPADGRVDPRAVLQQDPVHAGRHHRSAEDVGRAARGREEALRARQRDQRLRHAAG